MWRLYQTAKATATRPSDLTGIVDRWAALQFDNAVVYLGGAIDGAAQEMANRGDDEHPRWEPKYSMAQLLDPTFRIPLEDEAEPLRAADLQHDGMLYDEVGG